jgi:hypothetical protein
MLTTTNENRIRSYVDLAIRRRCFFQDLIAVAVARLDLAECELWDAWERSCQPVTNPFSRRATRSKRLKVWCFRSFFG